MRLRSLAIQLSKLQEISSPNLNLEQYQTEGEIAARWLFDIQSFDDLKPGCRVVDLGCGNGILGIGAVLMGAGSAILVDSDEKSCEVSTRNVESLGISDSVKIVNSKIGEKDIEIREADIVVSNPPWGTQKKASDRPFLEEIISIGTIAHLMHSSQATHIRNFFNEFGWSSEEYGDLDFALPATYGHHSRMRGRTRASLWRISPK
jgi:predicted RNA methylase|tara:strand:+ start:612 stop:1226 length:615 start_codon:yes stop_codon:yes gene_type:complete